MTTKTKPSSAPARPSLLQAMPAGPWLAPPWTTEERLQRIEAMGQRIHAYVQFMCQIGNLHGTSAEAKDRAVADFYERMLVLEKQLDRIQEDLKLG